MEHRIRNAGVVGSNPIGGTILFNDLAIDSVRPNYERVATGLSTGRPLNKNLGILI